MSVTELLAHPVEQSARRLALALLERAGAVSDRLREPADAEALHDFRVAIRRLRSTLRAYRPWLADSLSKKLLARLRDLAAATNPGRDAEVQLAWVEAQRPYLRRHQRPGQAWLAKALAERRDRAYQAVRERSLADFEALAGKLRARLSRYRIEVDLERGWHSRSLGEVLVEILEEHLQELAHDLAQVSSLADEREAHAARLEAKRLRYLLEPFADELPAAKAAIRSLRALQDLLGELNDAHLLLAEIGRAHGVAAGERARLLHELALGGAESAAELRRTQRQSERPGLLALGQRLAARRDALFADLAAHWLSGRAEPFLSEVRSLAQQLSAAGASQQPAPARRRAPRSG